MKQVIWSGITAAIAVLTMSTPTFAQANVGTINVSVVVAARAKLTLDTATISFTDADPDVTPTLTSLAVGIDVKTRTSSDGPVTLTVQATGDLTSAGGDTIGINQLTWTTTGSNFVDGTSSSAAAQTIGSWTGPGNRNGTQTYALPNSWSYATGTYTTTLNYTLTAP